MAAAAALISAKRNLQHLLLLLPWSFFYANCCRLPLSLLSSCLCCCCSQLAMHNANTIFIAYFLAALKQTGRHFCVRSLRETGRESGRVGAVLVYVFVCLCFCACVCLFVCLSVCRVNYADQTQRLTASSTTPSVTTTRLNLPPPATLYFTPLHPLHLKCIL